MPSKFTFLSTFLLLFFPGFVIAQNFGGHPPSVKWLQINTENVRVIFPEGQDENAARIAKLINYIHNEKLESIGTRTKKIDLVLQTNQVQSNGYVSLIPFRSEFYGVPFQSNHVLGSINWLDGLAIHEYRHVLQYTNANRGATKILNIISGEPGWTAAMNLSVPNWYFEGDAVMSETVLSSSGRGRTPAFFKEQRALLLNNIDYRYIKARNGSYKDLVPNHYPLGYAIMNYGRNHFGTTVWKDVLADAGAYASIIYPFSGAMKKHTGMRAPEMYRASYQEMKTNWETELEQLTLTKQTVLTPKNTKTVTNNQFAHFIDDGNIVYLSSSYKKTAGLYLHSHGNPTLLTSVGITVSTFLSENNGILAWVEYETDPRWSNQTFNKIVAYDLKSQEKKVIANRTKLFSPEFSHSGNEIVAVEIGTDLKAEIKLLDASSGTVTRRLRNPDGHFISYPAWTKDDKAIVYVAKSGSQLSIQKYDLESNQITAITPWTHHAIGEISVGSQSVIFSASFTGIDNIFSVSLNGDQEIRQLTSVPVGAYQPDISANENRIVMSEFTEMGYILTSLSVSDADNSIIELTEPKEMDRFNITLSENEGDILDQIPDQEYEIKKYRGFMDGMKLHTWGYSGEDDFLGLKFGASNILNDVNVEVNGIYNKNEEAMQFTANAQYGKYFTVMNFETGVTNRSTIFLDDTDTLRIKRFHQNSVSAGLSVPLLWQRGNYYTGLTLSSDYVNYQVDESFSRTSGGFNFGSFETILYFYNLHRTAHQNLQSRFGQYLIMYYSKALNKTQGERFNAQAGLYLPGLSANHGIFIEAEYQKELLRNSYQYADYFNYARGYLYVLNDEARRLSINYKLPLFYPDWGFFNFAYFKRIKANFFYDVAESKVHFVDYSLTQKSYGAELTFDNVMLNILPISFVLRQSFLPDAFDGDPTSSFEFFITFSF